MTDAKTLAERCAQLLDEQKIEDIVIIDVRRLSDLTDFFVIGTGRTNRQVQATAQKLREAVGKVGGHAPVTEGYDDGTWVLVDLFDVIVHLLQPEQRSYYNLEMIWGDAPRVKWK